MRRYLLRIARSLAEKGLADVRIVGEQEQSTPRWLGGFRKLTRDRMVARAISEFNPHIIHCIGPSLSQNVAEHRQNFVTFEDNPSPRPAVAIQVAPLEHIICPSEAAKARGVRMLGISPDRISVVVPGALMPGGEGARRAAKGSFLLFVGQRGGLGNFDSLLQAVSTTPTLHDTRIVAFGGGSFSRAERRRIASLGLTGRAIAAEGNQVDLSDHYASALAFVQTSLDDGFGLNVLDAMAHGCPVACSRSGAPPEMGGDAALYFDAADINDIATTLVHLAADAGLRERLAEAACKRAALFSVSACADRALEGYLEFTTNAQATGIPR